MLGSMLWTRTHTPTRAYVCTFVSTHACACVCTSAFLIAILSIRFLQQSESCYSGIKPVCLIEGSLYREELLLFHSQHYCLSFSPSVCCPYFFYILSFLVYFQKEHGYHTESRCFYWFSNTNTTPSCSAGKEENYWKSSVTPLCVFEYVCVWGWVWKRESQIVAVVYQ